MADWLATVPDSGEGLLLTQFQESPPAEPGTAPAGNESSTQLTALVIGGGLLVLVPPPPGGGVTMAAMFLPVLSQVAPPSNWLKAIPLRVEPSRPTWLAGT